MTISYLGKLISFLLVILLLHKEVIASQENFEDQKLGTFLSFNSQSQAIIDAYVETIIPLLSGEDPTEAINTTVPQEYRQAVIQRLEAQGYLQPESAQGTSRASSSSSKASFPKTDSYESHSPFPHIHANFFKEPHLLKLHEKILQAVDGEEDILLLRQ